MEFGLSAQTQNFETKTISFRLPVPLDKGNAGAGDDIETITAYHRLQKWQTTAFVCYPGPRQNSQYNGADHKDRNHVAVAVLNIN